MLSNRKVKRFVCSSLATMMLVAGCGGQNANCVDRYMPGDENRSCAALYAEIQTIDGEIVSKNAKIKDRDGTNAFLFVAGWFVIVPWFFIDSKESFEQEIEALEARQKQLKIFFADNGCDVSDLKTSKQSDTGDKD